MSFLAFKAMHLLKRAPFSHPIYIKKHHRIGDVNSQSFLIRKNYKNLSHPVEHAYQSFNLLLINHIEIDTNDNINLFVPLTPHGFQIQQPFHHQYKIF